jgi:histidine ammonia-lyase
MATLLRTSRFDVWSLGGEVGIVKKDEKKDPSKCVPVGAGRKVLVSDVSKVAALHYAVSLDLPSLEKIDAELVQTAGVSFDVKKSMKTFSAAANAVYPVTLCRAAVFARISSLMQGKSLIRSEVIQLLADMLDADAVPNFSSAENAGNELVAVLSGADSTCYFKGDIVSTSSALRRAGLAPVQLFADEAATLQNGQFFSTGVASLVASGAANVLSMADGVAALSCEAFGVNVEHFDAARFDSSRQHRGQMASASNLRLMLEGSKRVNSSNSKSGSSFETVPQTNGPAQESVAIAIK